MVTDIDLDWMSSLMFFSFLFFFFSSLFPSLKPSMNIDICCILNNRHWHRLKCYFCPNKEVYEWPKKVFRCAIGGNFLLVHVVYRVLLECSLYYPLIKVSNNNLITLLEYFSTVCEVRFLFWIIDCFYTFSIYALDSIDSSLQLKKMSNCYEYFVLSL